MFCLICLNHNIYFVLSKFVYKAALKNNVLLVYNHKPKSICMCTHSAIYVFCLINLVRVFFSVGEKIWVGARQDQSNVSLWFWLSGEVIGDTNGGQLWTDSRPVEAAGRSCAVLKYRNKTGEYGLYDIECNDTKKYFCFQDLYL